VLSAMRVPIQAAAHGCETLKKESRAILHNSPPRHPLLGREGKGDAVESLSVPSPNQSTSVRETGSSPTPFTFQGSTIAV